MVTSSSKKTIGSGPLPLLLDINIRSIGVKLVLTGKLCKWESQKDGNQPTRQSSSFTIILMSELTSQ